MKALNRSFEEREINKIIKNLDKSRSSRHKQEFPKFNKNKDEEKKPDNDNKLNYLIIKFKQVQK